METKTIELEAGLMYCEEHEPDMRKLNVHSPDLIESAKYVHNEDEVDSRGGGDKVK